MENNKNIELLEDLYCEFTNFEKYITTELKDINIALKSINNKLDKISSTQYNHIEKSNLQHKKILDCHADNSELFELAMKSVNTNET